MSTIRLRVAVVGSQGQLSRCLAENLRADRFEIIQVGRPLFDLLNPAPLKRHLSEIRPNIVVNAAAYTAVDKAEDEQMLASDINTAGAAAIAEAAWSIEAPIIHISTDYVFDGSKREPYNEHDKPAPLNVYGRTKLEGERCVAAANPRHVILRTAWLFSPLGKNFFNTVLRLRSEMPIVRIVNDQFGSPTYAAELAKLTGVIASKVISPDVSAAHFGLFHAVNSSQATWYDLAAKINSVAYASDGRNIPIQPIATADFPTKAKRPAYTVLSTDKLYDTYGVRLAPWGTAVEECFKAYREPGLQSKTARGF